MRFENLSRRDFLVVAGGGLALSTLTGCPPAGAGVAAVTIRVVPTLSRVFWGAVRYRATALTLKALANGAEKFLSPPVSSSDVSNLQSLSPLIIQDGKGENFNTPYVLCESAGIVQSCYRGEPRTLYEEPNFSADVVKRLEIGEVLGVIDLTHLKGWYHVQTIGGEKGWVHGNCLEPLPEG